MSKDRDNILCEYSDKESAFVKGALSSDGPAEGKRFRMELRATEYVLCDFTMYAEDIEDTLDPTDSYMENEDTEAATGEEILAKIFAEAERHPASEEYTITCDAFMTRGEDGRIIISYKEAIDGETEQTSQISFDPTAPELVMIHKSGVVSSTMIIETGRRHSCVYHTPFMDFEMRLHALRADNGITAEGGRLRLDYALEIKGAAAHRTVMDITLSEAD